MLIVIMLNVGHMMSSISGIMLNVFTQSAIILNVVMASVTVPSFSEMFWSFLIFKVIYVENVSLRKE